MDVSQQMVEKVMQCLIDENQSLRKDVESLKESIDILINNLEDLNDVINDIEEFSKKSEDDQVLEFIRLKKTIKMMEDEFFGRCP